MQTVSLTHTDGQLNSGSYQDGKNRVRQLVIGVTKRSETLEDLAVFHVRLLRLVESRSDCCDKAGELRTLLACTVVLDDRAVLTRATPVKWLLMYERSFLTSVFTLSPKTICLAGSPSRKM
jgi:hypothetical protein